MKLCPDHWPQYAGRRLRFIMLDETPRRCEHPGCAWMGPCNDWQMPPKYAMGPLIATMGSGDYEEVRAALTLVQRGVVSGHFRVLKFSHTYWELAKKHFDKVTFLQDGDDVILL